MQNYSRLNAAVTKPYAIGERPDGHVPFMPFMSGQEAVDSLRGYYPTRRIDSKLNPHTYQRPAQGRSTAMPRTKLAMLHVQAQKANVAKVLAAMTPEQSLFVSGFLTKCAEHKLNAEAMLIAITAAGHMHPAIAEEFEKCGFVKQAIGADYRMPGGDFYKPPTPSAVSPSLPTYYPPPGTILTKMPRADALKMRSPSPTPPAPTPSKAPDATSFFSNLMNESYTPGRNLANYGMGVANLGVAGLGRVGSEVGRKVGDVVDGVTGNSGSPYGMGKFFNGLNQHFDQQMRGGMNSIMAGATNSTPEQVAARNGTQSTQQLRRGNAEFLRSLPDNAHTRVMGMSPNTQSDVANLAGNLGDLAGMGAITMGGGGPLAAAGLGRAGAAAAPIGNVLSSTAPGRLAVGAARGVAPVAKSLAGMTNKGLTALNAEAVGRGVEGVINSGQPGDSNYQPTSVGGFLQHRDAQQQGPQLPGQEMTSPVQQGPQQPPTPAGVAAGAAAGATGTQLPGVDEQLQADLQNLVTTNPGEAQALAGQVTDMATNAIKQNPELATNMAGALQGDPQAANALKTQAAQSMAEQGMDQNTIMSNLQSMSLPEIIGLVLGIGTAAMGLMNIMSGEGGIGSWLMTLLGLGGAGMLAGNAGLLGEGAQNFTQGLTGQAGNLIGGLFGAGESGVQQSKLNPDQFQEAEALWKKHNFPISGGTDPNAYDPGDMNDAFTDYFTGKGNITPEQFSAAWKDASPELRNFADQGIQQGMNRTGAGWFLDSGRVDAYNKLKNG